MGRVEAPMNGKTPSLLLVGLLLAACSAGVPRTTTGPAPSTPPSATPATPTNPPGTNPPTAIAPIGSNPADPSGIDGRTFLSIGIKDGDQVRPLVPGTVIRISFNGNQISVQAGCNSFGGTYRLDGDTLVVDGGAMTEMGCDGPRHAQDDWIFGLIGSSPTIALRGDDLVINAGQTTIEMKDREVVEPDQALVGPTWVLTSIITGQTVSSVPDNIVATIKFNDDGSLEVHPGCNSGGGSYTVDGDRITFDEVFLTEMACMGAGGQVEATVLSVLDGAQITFAIDAGSLTLMAGDLGLQFTAQ
ncbi:MAG TPA: META domain-containing protein [Candidatus Limnocylindrales bacterium]|nr:META domain-containing protein [Candidatus Limnocylindrales bacterium]